MSTRVKLRVVTAAERRQLRTRGRDLTLSARIHQRYRIIDEMRKGRAPGDVADRVEYHFTVVYPWVRRYNAAEFATLERAPNPKGRPPILEGAQLRRLVDVALSRSRQSRPFHAIS
jgi:transposase